MQNIGTIVTSLSRQLAQERSSHEAFAASRRYAHVPRSHYLDQLDRHALGNGAPLVIHAPSGAGKSALLAYWADTFRERYPDTFIVEHYIGSGTADALPVVRHVMLEIKERYGLADEIPHTPEAFRRALAPWLWYTHSSEENALPGHGMILLIDAVNQLADEGRDLSWLPERIPPSVKLVITTTSSETLAELQRRGWETILLQPFTLSERRQMVQRFVAERSTAMTGEQVKGVASAAGSANPLLLRTRLEEVRAVADSKGGAGAIEEFLGARDLDELYAHLLLRLESEYGHDLVERTLGLLQVSQQGLYASELAPLTGADSVEIAKLIERLDFHLLRRNDLLGFVHEYLGKAITSRYLSVEGREQELRRAIAHHLQTLPLLHRTAVEIATQFSLVGDDNDLVEFISRIPVVTQLYRGESQYDLLGYWRRLGPRFDITSTYSDSLAEFRTQTQNDPETLLGALQTLGTLLEAVGRWEAARELYAEELALAEQIARPSAIGWAAGSLGMIYYRQGEYARAMEYYRIQERISRETGDLSGMSRVLSSMAAVLFHLGDYTSAMEHSNRKLEICTQLGDRHGIALSLGGIGSVCFRQGDHAKAMDYFRQQLAISEGLGDRRAIALTLGNMGVIHSQHGDISSAIGCYQRQLEISEELDDRPGMVSAHGHMGNIHRHQGNLAAALSAFEQQLGISEELGFKSGVAGAVGGMGDIFTSRGEYARALAALRRQLALVRGLGDRGTEAQVLLRIAEVYMQQRDFSTATDYYAQALELASALDETVLWVHASIGSVNATLNIIREDPEQLQPEIDVLQGILGVLETTHDLAQQLGIRSALFTAKHLRTIVEFLIAPNNTEREHILNGLASMLDGDEDLSGNDNVSGEATIREEMAWMQYKLGLNDEARNSVMSAIALYNDLYASTGINIYIARAEQLQKTIR